ncbi:hypothetical protein FRX31_030884 [Thalictrum thalictroides]|uniref:Uncharacterized protein n=1 Tax=Thalictrum thalictroides TaxID=46969 RepID=A0A7J6V5L7_THATH|nr:hypothetical protein FRX31_030884 [Thalictrum thalictroides]
MEVIQNWLATKLANEKQIKNLTRMNSLVDGTSEVAKTIGTVTMLLKHDEDQRGPKASLEKMEPTNEAIPALPIYV